MPANPAPPADRNMQISASGHYAHYDVVNGTSAPATALVAAGRAGRQIAVYGINLSANGTIAANSYFSSDTTQVFPRFKGVPGSTLCIRSSDGVSPLFLCADGEDLNLTDDTSRTQFSVVYSYV